MTACAQFIGDSNSGVVAVVTLKCLKEPGMRRCCGTFFLCRARAFLVVVVVSVLDVDEVPSLV